MNWPCFLCGNQTKETEHIPARLYLSQKEPGVTIIDIKWKLVHRCGRIECVEYVDERAEQLVNNFWYLNGIIGAGLRSGALKKDPTADEVGKFLADHFHNHGIDFGTFAFKF